MCLLEALILLSLSTCYGQFNGQYNGHLGGPLTGQLSEPKRPVDLWNPFGVPTTRKPGSVSLIT
jgi:hypothetical protein